MIEVKVENTSEAKMDLKPVKEKTVKPLSFSISSILGDSDQKKSEDIPRVPATYYGTIHHYGHPESTNYQHFEAQLPPRACSTPENDYPSPTQNVVPAAFRALQSQASTPSSYPLLQNQDSSYFIPHRNGTSPVTRHIDNVSPEPEIDIPRHSNNHLFEKSSDKSLDSMGESYQQSPSPLKAKKKKTRTVFSRSQVYQLESAFDMKRYLSSTERAGLASSLNLSETQIKIWFQNRRNKWKRQINGEMDEIPIPPAFAASYMPSPLAQPPSLNSYSSIIDSREGFLRGGLTVPAYYSHPYARESRLRETYLSALK